MGLEVTLLALPPISIIFPYIEKDHIIYMHIYEHICMYIHMYICTCLSVCMYMGVRDCHSAHVELRGQIAGVLSLHSLLFTSCRSGS